MIQGTPTILQLNPWQQSLAQAVTDPADLLKRLELPISLLPAARKAAELFSLQVPLPYLARIEKANPNDPLLRQVLPISDELLTVDGFTADPVGDHASIQSPGLLHKYHGRALILTTGACGIHCRYCFRRHFNYAESNPAKNQWHDALAVIKADHNINEVILSGGDPLSLSDNKLTELVQKLEKIPHLKRLRLHTRLPVVLPERITTKFLTLLENTRFTTIVVLHINHAQEIDNSVKSICNAITKTGTQLLNQAVLLAGINDTAQSLCDLSERLSDCSILPYYLHQLDRVAGAAHFEVSDEQAKSLHSKLQTRLPGYLVPKLVREIAGETGKSAL
ncbi:MAG: EF-P beta-lysylation protein EpmB [Sulfuriflexus sp.]|nr:EF-P beta-lysylation protein EpmB [Sulfuriflexus sp.]